MPDLSHLTPDEVFEKYKNKEIKISVVIALLREKIRKSRKSKVLDRIFTLLELLDLNQDQYYSLINSLAFQNINVNIKEKSYRIMIQDYFERCKDSLKYTIINENEFRVIGTIYIELNKKNSDDAQKLIDILEKRFSWKHTSLYDVNSKEAMGLGIIELVYGGVGIGVTEPCALIECCINFRTENGHVISLTANETDFPLPEILQIFPELKSLRFEMGCFNEIKSFRKLDKLEYLEITDSNLSEIKNLDTLTNLKTLVLKRNEIKEIKGLDNLVNLEKLELDENQIEEIENLENLVNLKSLSLGINDISEIKGLTHLTKLEELILDENRISEIKGLENLSKLRVLNLGSNIIREIKGIGNLVNLKKIYLNSNQIPKKILEKFKDVDNAQAYVAYSR